MAYKIGAPKKIKLFDLIPEWTDEETEIELTRLNDERALGLMNKKDLLSKLADGTEPDAMKEALGEVKDIMREGIVGFSGFEFPNGESLEEQREQLINDLPHSVRYHISGAIIRLTITGDALGKETSSES